MSVIVIGRFEADPARLEQVFLTHAQTLIDISVEGKAKGAIHHQFGAGDGEVIIVDEWPDEASFQEFFAGQTDIPKIMAEVGVTTHPTFQFFRRMDSPDAF